MADERHAISIDTKRREWHGAGVSAPEGAERVLSVARGGKRCAWGGVGHRAGRGLDQVDVERLLWAAVDAGLVVISERRNRRGDWEPYRWHLTGAGEALFASEEEPVDIDAYLNVVDDASHPVLASIRAWLERRAGSAISTCLVMAIGRELRAGRIPRERLLSTTVAGASKAIRIDHYRAELEDALGLPVDGLVRKSGDAVIVAGPIRFQVRGITTDARGIPPWIALPAETVEAMESLVIEADRLVTIENLTPFEEEARRGLEPGTIALYIGGFAGRLERRMLERFVSAGIRRIDHWSDLDVGGLRILRHVRSLLPIEVRRFRMDPELLVQLPSAPLTDNDKMALRAWLSDPDAPDIDLALALLESGRKVEQEGWFVKGASELP